MLFLVRGKNRNHDRILRVHAEDQADAEQIGWKRGLFVTEVTPIADGDPQVTWLDRAAGLAWRAWRATPRNSLRCFGRSVSTGQAATLVLLGFATWALNLHALGIVTL